MPGESYRGRRLWSLLPRYLCYVFRALIITSLCVDSARALWAWQFCFRFITLQLSLTSHSPHHQIHTLAMNLSEWLANLPSRVVTIRLCKISHSDLSYYEELLLFLLLFWKKKKWLSVSHAGSRNIRHNVTVGLDQSYQVTLSVLHRRWWSNPKSRVSGLKKK